MAVAPVVPVQRDGELQQAERHEQHHDDGIGKGERLELDALLHLVEAAGAADELDEKPAEKRYRDNRCRELPGDRKVLHFQDDTGAEVHQNRRHDGQIEPAARRRRDRSGVNHRGALPDCSQRKASFTCASG
jgi:hypothetical protein